MENNFLNIAENLKPNLVKTKVLPTSEIKIIYDQNSFQNWTINKIGTIEDLTKRSLSTSDSFTVDFGDHQVGYLTFSIKSLGSPQDAPLRLKLTLGEMPCEIEESHDDYNGWISRSWLQDEIINIDVLPCTITLPRRYSFRYLKIDIVATSQKYSVQFADIYCLSVSSADMSKVPPLPDRIIDNDIIQMDKIGLKTLHDCMQSVFEDGPKRDRRLWIGDLRLQALANYYTFKNYDLVKRCLYLFAGLPEDNGSIGACLFLEPKLLVDDTILYDYSLFFISVLHDYYLETKDIDTLNNLWPVAIKQIEIALKRVDEKKIVIDDDTWWCFIDWHPDLNKQTSAQAVLIYTMKQARVLADLLNDIENANMLDKTISDLSQAALKYLFDYEKGFFISGNENQISYASQVWMVLAQVLPLEENGRLLDRLLNTQISIGMTTPYMYHHLIEALIISDRKELALKIMKSYWGEMINDGADCFFEAYNPQNKFESPYGSNLINSYCHAWSCTTTYFIRKYFV